MYVNTGFVQVMENLESHGIGYFNFQAWKVVLSENKKAKR